MHYFRCKGIRLVTHSKSFVYCAFGPGTENASECLSDNQIGEKPRGGIRYRGKTRGFRSARRGGTWRGTTDSHLESKNEVEGEFTKVVYAQ